MNARTALVFGVALLVVVGLGGCRSGSKGGKGGYTQAFEEARYAEAYDAASRAANGKTGQDRERAALIAGLSAQALDRSADAERWLAPLLTSPDNAVAGRAGAALGLISQEMGNHREAAALLSKASTKLAGDEAARASMYAGDSYKAMSQGSDAVTAYSRASAMVEADDQLRSMIADRMAGNGPGGAGVGPGMWSVQVGAFSNPKAAQTEASRIGSFGDTRVVQITSSKGQRLHAVRIGAFGSRPEAEALKRRVGASARVVTTDGEGQP